MKPLEFSLVSENIPVTLRRDGEVRVLELRQLSAADRDRYMDLLVDRMRLDKEGKLAGVKKFDGMHADLLSLCLYQDGKQVPKAEIQQWPAVVVTSLFESAQEHNQLNKIAAEAAGELVKND